MKSEIKNEYGTKICIDEFNSLGEFENYINNTPFNNVFRWAKHQSVGTGVKYNQWSGTKSFQEALNLFKNGWDKKAEELTQKLKFAEMKTETSTIKRSNYDVVGFQCSVPRYLQGIPTSMINKKNVPQKQKVITLNKIISYSNKITPGQIIDSSIKTLQLIKRIEEQGIRVNLNVIYGVEKNRGYLTERIIAKIRVKNSGEKLNISKLAFPLVHPSMQRRLFFRYTEVTPNITFKEFVIGYGTPLTEKEYTLACKDEIILPSLVNNIEELIEKVVKKF